MRLGGDEFGVFAVGIANREMGEGMVHRRFSRVDALEVPGMQGRKTSISVGAVIAPEGGAATFHDLYAIADEALYRSKKTAGNSMTFGRELPSG